MSNQIYTSFDKLGATNISIRVRKVQGGDFVQKDFQVNIERGNAVKINKTRLISFFNINETWDDEFPDTDINRLADLIFAFSKNYFVTSFNEIEHGNKQWFLSTILVNQGGLTWDLEEEELYIDPNFRFYFGLGDDDGNGIGQDILLGPPFELEYNLMNDILEEPMIITLAKQDINLEVEFDLDW